MYTYIYISIYLIDFSCNITEGENHLLSEIHPIKFFWAGLGRFLGDTYEDCFETIKKIPSGNLT